MSHIEQLRQVMIACNAGGPVEAADDLLAATYPPACQTCEGTRIPMHDCGPCPDCPTIAQLLAWGVAVATAEIELGLVEWGDQSWLYADRLLDAIRAVKP